MARAKTLQNVMSAKHQYFKFDGIWAETLGKPSTNGIWLIYGKEKQGKTSFALKLAEYMSSFKRVLYVSAEEGTELEFKENIARMNLDITNRNLHFLDYLSMEELKSKLKSRKAEDIIFLDNMTIYCDEMKGSDLKALIREYPQKLFVVMSHEERNQPYPSVSRTASKLAKRIMRVRGLTVEISGRGSAGGILVINEEKAMIYHGSEIKTKIY